MSEKSYTPCDLRRNHSIFVFPETAAGRLLHGVEQSRSQDWNHEIHEITLRIEFLPAAA
jgi:hypothetical protein